MVPIQLSRYCVTVNYKHIIRGGEGVDTPITRAEHEAFSELMKAENQRLKDENDRQNKRLELLENNMNQIITQQLTTLTATIERLNLSVSNVLKEQADISERLKKLENQDGDMWRTVVKYAITAIVGGVITFVLIRTGMR